MHLQIRVIFFRSLICCPSIYFEREIWFVLYWYELNTNNYCSLCIPKEQKNHYDLLTCTQIRFAKRHHTQTQGKPDRAYSTKIILDGEELRIDSLFMLHVCTVCLCTLRASSQFLSTKRVCLDFLPLIKNPGQASCLWPHRRQCI